MYIHSMLVEEKNAMVYFFSRNLQGKEQYGKNFSRRALYAFIRITSFIIYLDNLLALKDLSSRRQVLDLARIWRPVPLECVMAIY